MKDLIKKLMFYNGMYRRNKLMVSKKECKLFKKRLPISIKLEHARIDNGTTVPKIMSLKVVNMLYRELVIAKYLYTKNKTNKLNIDKLILLYNLHNYKITRTKRNTIHIVKLKRDDL